MIRLPGLATGLSCPPRGLFARRLFSGRASGLSFAFILALATFPVLPAWCGDLPGESREIAPEPTPEADAPAGAVPGDEGFSDWLPLEDDSGLTVTGERLPAQSAERVSRDRILDSGAGTLAELLEAETGLSVSGYGGRGTAGSLSAGGFSGARVGVTINGVPLNSPLTGGFDPGDVDPESLDSVEILGPGAGSGGLAGGSVALSLAGPVDGGFRLSASAENLAYLSAKFPDPAFASPLDSQTLRFSAERGYAADESETGGSGWRVGGFAGQSMNRFPWTDGNGAERLRESAPVGEAGMNASLFLRLSPWTDLSAVALARGAERTVAGPVDSPASGGEQRDWRTVESLTVDSARLGSDAFVGGLSLGHTSYRLLWQDGTGMSRNDSDTLSASARLGWYPSREISFALGADARGDAVRSDHAGKRTGGSGTLEAKAEWRPAASFVATPSLGIAGDGSSVVPVPSLALAWAWGSGSSAGVSAWRTYRFPSLNDLWWSGDPTAEGNPDLLPEDGWGGGARFRRREARWDGSLEARGTWYRNAVQWSVDNSVWSPENLGEAFVFDAGASLGWEPAKGTRLSGRYEWLFTRVVTGDLDWGDGKYLPYSPVHRARFGISREVSSARLRLAGEYVGSRFTGILNASALSPYFTLDAGAFIPLGAGFSADMGLRNAFGESYELLEGYPMPGTSLSLKLEWRLEP